MRTVVYSIQTHGGAPRGYMDAVEEEDVDEFIRDTMKLGDLWVIRDMDAFYETCRTAITTEFQRLVMGLWDGRTLKSTEAIIPGPRKSVPQLPPETWATPRKDVDYMAEVRAMCGGTR